MRRRRDAAEARTALLDAAERRLVMAGPAGIRLQDVAADAGVSHPTVLHHFGSREALVDAVVARTLAAIHSQLVATIAASTGEPAQLAAMLDAMFDVLASGGHARVILWLALEGHALSVAGAGLSDVVDAAHALRAHRHRDRAHKAPREDTGFAVLLSSLALLGFAVLGPTMLQNAGMAHDAAAGARFRAWLARLIADHMDREGAPAAR